MRSNNSQIIKRAFARLQDSESRVIQEGMVRLAKAGLEYLVEVHNLHGEFMKHTTETDTMAWAVAHDGAIIASGCHDGGYDDMPGSAQRTAESLLNSTTGWVAIILSEMDGYYRVDYEENFLFDTSFKTASEFKSYFKKVS